MNPSEHQPNQIRNVIITGSAGYLGKKLTRMVLDKTSASVIGIDRAAMSCVNPRLQTLQCDLSTPEGEAAIQGLAEKLQDAAIFHLAGLFVKDISLSSQFSSVAHKTNNLIATQRLVNAILHTPYRPRLFVFSSTACIYDGAQVHPTPVEMAFPITPYGESKLFAEREISKLEGWVRHVVMLRLSRVLGDENTETLPRDIVSDFIEKVAEADASNTSCFIGSGAEIRPYIYIENLMDIFLSLLKKENQKELVLSNVTSLEPLRVGEISNIVAETMKNTGLLRGKPELDIRSDAKTRVPFLYPLPDPDFPLKLDESKEVVQQAAQQYCIMLKQLIEAGNFSDLLTAIKKTREPGYPSGLGP